MTRSKQLRAEHQWRAEGTPRKRTPFPPRRGSQASGDSTLVLAAIVVSAAMVLALLVFAILK